MDYSRRYYRGGEGQVLESALRLSPDAMSKEQFFDLDRRQEAYLAEVSRLFPITLEDVRLTQFTSDHADKRFAKGDRQFCAAAETLPTREEFLWDLQQDQRLGNGSTCAERFLLHRAKKEKRVVTSITVYRGENVELAQTPEGGWALQTLQKRGGEDKRQIKNLPTMRHMVGPCAYCREGLCHQNPSAMVIMPPGFPKPKANVIKVPAFLTYPEGDLLRSDDPLLKKLELSGKKELVQARIRQKEFFKEMAMPLSERDRTLLAVVQSQMSKVQPGDRPYMIVGGSTITDQIVKVGDYVDAAPTGENYDYLQYNRNSVEVEFVHELLEEPHFPPPQVKRPGSSHALNVFVELYREPGSKEGKLILPNADTRQRIAERFLRSYILVELDGEAVKLPSALLYPDRYKRLDKVGGRV